MLSYGDYEEVCSDVPVFRFIAANREVVQRLIVRAATAKNEKEFVNMLKWNLVYNYKYENYYYLIR